MPSDEAGAGDAQLHGLGVVAVDAGDRMGAVDVLLELRWCPG